MIYLPRCPICGLRVPGICRLISMILTFMCAQREEKEIHTSLPLFFVCFFVWGSLTLGLFMSGFSSLGSLLESLLPRRSFLIILTDPSFWSLSFQYFLILYIWCLLESATFFSLAFVSVPLLGRMFHKSWSLICLLCNLSIPST